MAAFFKGLAKGLLYFLFFPFGLLAIALYAVFGLFVFVFQFIKLIFLFFTGRNLQSDLPEDIEVKKIIESKKPKVEEEEDKELSMSLYPSDSIVYGGGYTSPLVEDKREETVEEKSSEEEETIDEEEKEEEEDDA